MRVHLPSDRELPREGHGDPLTEGTDWADVDAVVYFWVRQSRIASGLETRLLEAVRSWLADVWALPRTVFVTNEQFARQLELLEGAGLQRQFELREPDKPGAYVVFG